MKTALVFLHGMNGGSYDDVDAYSRRIFKKMSNKLPDDVKNELEFIPLIYQHFLEPEQQHTLELYKESGLGLKWIRRFLVNHFGDALGYEYAAEKNDSTKECIQNHIDRELQKICGKLGNDGRLILMAESLGAHVIVDYLNDFGCPDQLELMLTQGCNIPLFMAARKEFEMFVPSNKDFKWFNYYYKNDVLGWPLKLLEKNNTGFEHIVTEDVCLGRGWWIASHQHYINSRHCKKLARTIADVVRRPAPDSTGCPVG